MTEPNLSEAFGTSAAAQQRAQTPLAGILPRRSEQSTPPPQHPSGADSKAPAVDTAPNDASTTAADQRKQHADASAAERQSSTDTTESPTQTSDNQHQQGVSDSPSGPIPADPTPAGTANTAADQQKHPLPGAQSTATVPVSVYVRPETRAAARRRIRGHQRIAHAEIAIEAIEAQHSNLKDLVAARHTTQVRPGGGLFPARHALRSGGDGPRRVLWTIFLTDAEIAVIDRLCEETRAESRSELISAAVEAHLAPRGRRR